MQERDEYIKRLEKRNGLLEKQAVDQNSYIKELEKTISAYESRQEENMRKIHSLEKIRKDIMYTVTGTQEHRTTHVL